MDGIECRKDQPSPLPKKTYTRSIYQFIGFEVRKAEIAAGRTCDMGALRVMLFRRFHAEVDDQPLVGFEARKMQELFCYLLLHRDHPHSREVLAELLWNDNSA